MAAFRGMHVSPANHSYAWLSRKCDYRTNRHTHTRTHRQTPDKVIPMCRYASQATQKFSCKERNCSIIINNKITKYYTKNMKIFTEFQVLCSEQLCMTTFDWIRPTLIRFSYPCNQCSLWMANVFVRWHLRQSRDFLPSLLRLSECRTCFVRRQMIG